MRECRRELGVFPETGLPLARCSLVECCPAAVLALLAGTAREDRWREALGMIAFVQLYLVIAGWVWIEGGRKPRCRRNHPVEGGRPLLVCQPGEVVFAAAKAALPCAQVQRSEDT